MGMSAMRSLLSCVETISATLLLDIMKHVIKLAIIPVFNFASWHEEKPHSTACCQVLPQQLCTSYMYSYRNWELRGKTSALLSFFVSFWPFGLCDFKSSESEDPSPAWQSCCCTSIWRNYLDKNRTNVESSKMFPESFIFLMQNKVI